ncbi:MAG: FAD-binding protein, partial [Cyclobacteriaceae bacterium]|nr:FAD-binding protein [Cyclobacteriaceae bacterium]
IAMAYRAKANIQHMEFVQFHPTALYYPAQDQVFLISEAVRGFGAILKTKNGQEFMDKYDERASMASRDIVARAIDAELKARGDDCVYLDCRHLDIEKFKNHFPKIYNKCLSIGIDVSKEMIPVAPAAHYLCGGVVSDLFGHTNIKNLYVCGEVAKTGLHGANRLASNSLLEALVYAHRCFVDVQNVIEGLNYREDIPEWKAEGTTEPAEWILINHNRKEVQDIMSNYVGIVRSNERLNRALGRLELVYRETEILYKTTTISPQLCELRNLINVAYLIVKQSLAQDQNKGTFYNIDLD